ncbi:MAG: DUF2461 domain-containing protein [Nevskiaceae bacterium]|nr:MAG: DUF2461 domain-containing protein [Nevskiaceae bacterium]
MPAKSTPYFTPALFKFLRDLARHNDREWFTANKARYEAELKAPALRFIAALDAPLKQTVSPHFVASAKPVGGSLFRIYRDTRFSGDKSPYKTHVGMTFFHEATRSVARVEGGGNAAPGRLDAPLFYLHLQPGECFIGGGVWHGQPDTVKRIRNYMVNNPASWKKATRGGAFAKSFSLDGDSLSRPPQGYDPRHELIEDLKRKDFVCTATLSEEQVCAPDFQKTVLKHFAGAAPMIDWLCGALDLDF